MKKILVIAICLFTVCLTSGCNSIFSYNLYEITQNGKIGLIDKTGKEIVESKFDNVILDNSEDLIAVKFNGLWGFINKKGEFVIIPQYEETKGFKYGLAFVKDKNFEGYIDKRGKYVWKQAVAKKDENTEQSDKNNTSKKTSKVRNDFADSIFDELGL